MSCSYCVRYPNWLAAYKSGGTIDVFHMPWDGARAPHSWKLTGGLGERDVFGSKHVADSHRNTEECARARASLALRCGMDCFKLKNTKQFMRLGAHGSKSSSSHGRCRARQMLQDAAAWLRAPPSSLRERERSAHLDWTRPHAAESFEEFSRQPVVFGGQRLEHGALRGRSPLPSARHVCACVHCHRAQASMTPRHASRKMTPSWIC